MTLSLDGDVIQDQVIELISQYGYEGDVILRMKVRDQSGRGRKVDACLDIY